MARLEPTQDQPQGMCLDAGYDYDEVYATLQEFGFTAHVRPREEEVKAIKWEAGFKARRWVVEREHSPSAYSLEQEARELPRLSAFRL